LSSFCAPTSTRNATCFCPLPCSCWE
jgi:hypothetical protein